MPQESEPARRTHVTAVGETGAPRTPHRFLYRLFAHVLPCARAEYTHWLTAADAIPDPTLRRQALASLRTKRFHADGGCVYAAAHPESAGSLVRLIIAYQTISDYLDNLCDRCDTYDADDFRQLHNAMRDAVRPGASTGGYYDLRRGADDGGYLQALVQTCQQELATLPGYATVAERVQWFAERYCELQQHKHIRPDLRESRLLAWWAEHEQHYPQLTWWEFAAATGSTLGIFALFAAATRSVNRLDADALADAYFPWIGGLHILLDYFIDLEEDKQEGDFNFVACYDSLDDAIHRMAYLASTGLACVKRLSGTSARSMHRYVIKGLLGMYLSDTKVRTFPHLRPVRAILWRFGPTAWVFYAACQVYRIVR